MNLRAWSPLASFRANTSNDHLSTFCVKDKKLSNNLYFSNRKETKLLYLHVCMSFGFALMRDIIIPSAQIWQLQGNWVPPYWRCVGTSWLNEIKNIKWKAPLRANTKGYNTGPKPQPGRFPTKTKPSNQHNPVWNVAERLSCDKTSTLWSLFFSHMLMLLGSIPQRVSFHQNAQLPIKFTESQDSVTELTGDALKLS